MNPFQNSFGGHIPQDVAGKQGENVIFIVYGLTDSLDAADKVKDVCANFPAMILQSPNQKIPDRKTKCVIKTHINIKQNVIFGAKLKPV